MALEARLPSFIREQRYFPISAQELALYKRQYAGLVRDGKQTIYVNLFSGEHEYWRQRVVGACDGGFGFFGVEYDVESRAFIHFASNGVA